MIPAITSKKDSMFEAAKRGFSTATDLADYLVRQGMPFRDAHEVVGKSVAYGLSTGKDLSEMTLDELQQFSDTIGQQDVFGVLKYSRRGNSSPSKFTHALVLATSNKGSE